MQLAGSSMPNRLPHSGGADDHGHSNRDLKRDKEHDVRYRLHYEPGLMSDDLLPTILPNWTIKRAGQDAKNRGEHCKAARAFAQAELAQASLT